MKDDFDDLFDYDEAAAVLGASLPPVAPPPSVKADLLRAIGAEPQTSGEAGAGTAATSRAGQSSADGRGNVRPLPRSRGRMVRFVLQGVAAVALVAVGVGVGRWSTIDSMEPTTHYAQLNQAQDVERVADVMPDGHVVTLTWSRGMEMAAVTLPAELTAPQSKSLQVWVRKDDGTVTSAGMYSPHSGSLFSFIDVMPEPGLEILITLEPQGGSEQPTSEPIVVLRVGDGESEGQGNGEESLPAPSHDAT